MSQFPMRPLRLGFDLDQQIEAAFATLIHEPWGRAEVLRSWQPAVDLYEADDVYLVEADLLGVIRNEIEVHVEDRLDVLRGHRRSVRLSQSECGVRIERAQGEAKTEAFDPFAIITVSGLKPAPIALNTKLVVLNELSAKRPGAH